MEKVRADLQLAFAKLNEVNTLDDYKSFVASMTHLFEKREMDVRIHSWNTSPWYQSPQYGCIFHFQQQGEIQLEEESKECFCPRNDYCTEYEVNYQFNLKIQHPDYKDYVFSTKMNLQQKMEDMNFFTHTSIFCNGELKWLKQFTKQDNLDKICEEMSKLVNEFYHWVLKTYPPKNKGTGMHEVTFKFKLEDLMFRD